MREDCTLSRLRVIGMGKKRHSESCIIIAVNLVQTKEYHLSQITKHLAFHLFAIGAANACCRKALLCNFIQDASKHFSEPFCLFLVNAFMKVEYQNSRLLMKKESK